jgi:hypothetical protein
MHTVTLTSLQFPRAYLFAMIMGMASFGVSSAEIKVTLSGDQEVPPVSTMASGTAQFTVNDDMSLSGSVETQGIKATAAHIHAGAVGNNGPVAVSLTMKSNNEWVVPANTKLTAEQMTKLKAGGMYVNVHSAAHTDGEIRAQLK